MLSFSILTGSFPRDGFLRDREQGSAGAAVMSVQWGAVRCSTEVRGWRHAEEVPAAYLTRSSRPAALFPERPAPRYEVRHSEHRAAHPPCVT